MSWTSVKIIKNEVGCRDDTVPKTVETRRHCEEDWEHATIFRNPLLLHLWFLGVAEDCCMLSILLAVPSCFNSFWHGVIPTSYFIFNDFYTCNIIGITYQCLSDAMSCSTMWKKETPRAQCHDIVNGDWPVMAVSEHRGIFEWQSLLSHPSLPSVTGCPLVLSSYHPLSPHPPSPHPPSSHLPSSHPPYSHPPISCHHSSQVFP